MQNGFVESVNGSFRDECLNETLFSSLAEARSQITAWKIPPLNKLYGQEQLRRSSIPIRSSSCSTWVSEFEGFYRPIAKANKSF